jgi:hypothetical protein
MTKAGMRKPPGLLFVCALQACWDKSRNLFADLAGKRPISLKARVRVAFALAKSEGVERREAHLTQAGLSAGRQIDPACASR